MKYLLFSGHVRGSDYYETPKILDQLKIGAPVELRREPGNACDYQAIEVYWKNNKLGYLPARSEAIWRLIHSKARLVTKITKLFPDFQKIHIDP